MQTYNLINNYIGIVDLTNLILLFAFGKQERKKDAFRTGYVEVCVDTLDNLKRIRTNIVGYFPDVYESILHEAFKGGHINIIILCIPLQNNTIMHSFHMNFFTSVCESENLHVLNIFVEDIIRTINGDFMTVRILSNGLKVAYKVGNHTLIPYLEKYYNIAFNIDLIRCVDPGNTVESRTRSRLSTERNCLHNAYYSEDSQTIELASKYIKLFNKVRYFNMMLKKACDTNQPDNVKKIISQMDESSYILNAKCHGSYITGGGNYYCCIKYKFARSIEIFKLMAVKLIRDGTVIPLGELFFIILKSGNMELIKGFIFLLSHEELHSYRLPSILSECNIRVIKYMFTILDSQYIQDKFDKIKFGAFIDGNIEAIEFLHSSFVKIELV